MMTKSLRKLVFTSHVTSSVGWLGAVVAYLAVAGIGLSTTEDQMARSAYLMTEVIIRFVIMPISLAAVLTGLVQSLGTEWGLFRHYRALGLQAVGQDALFGRKRELHLAGGMQFRH